MKRTIYDELREEAEFREFCRKYEEEKRNPDWVKTLKEPIILPNLIIKNEIKLKRFHEMIDYYDNVIEKIPNKKIYEPEITNCINIFNKLFGMNYNKTYILYAIETMKIISREYKSGKYIPNIQY